jgi:hypothetical protein
MPTPLDAAKRTYALAARLGVGIGEACDRAGINRSTPPRWKAGTSTPRQSHLFRLRAAINELAQERRTGTGGILDRLDERSVRTELTAIRAACDRVEAMLAEPAA